MMYALNPNGPSAVTVDVPPLLGLRADQARALLEPRGLLLVLSEEREDPRFAPGQVCEQRPLDGSRVHKGDTVTAALTRQSAQVKVPDVVGQQLRDARTRLETAKLAVGSVTEQSSSAVAAGSVISQSAAAGSDAHQGAAVDLVVSRGADAAAVPNVVGKQVAKAKLILTQAGFQPGSVHYKADEDRVDGIVMEQSPAFGTTAPKGAKVDLVVNLVE
jgi:serine/threonine-protein kinase